MQRNARKKEISEITSPTTLEMSTIMPKKMVNINKISSSMSHAKHIMSLTRKPQVTKFKPTAPSGLEFLVPQHEPL